MKTRPGIWSAILFLAFATMTVTNAWAAQRELSDDGNGGYYINMSATGTDTLVIPDGVTTFKVYDDGGAEGNYSIPSSSNETNLVLVAPQNYLLRLTGYIKTTYGFLSAYDGDNLASRRKISYLDGYKDVPNTLSSGQRMLINFETLPDYTNAGLFLTVTLVDLTVPHAIVIGEVANGSVSASHTEAVGGTQISLSVTPNEGYVLQSINVVDELGNSLAYDDYGRFLEGFTGGRWYSGNTATFTMSNTDATVELRFQQIDKYLDISEYDLPVSGTLPVIIPNGVSTFLIEPKGDGTEDIDIALNAPEGKILQIMSEDNSNSGNDSLYVYDGINDDANLLGKVPVRDMGRFISTQNVMTLHYRADGRFRSRDAFRVTILDPNEVNNITVTNGAGGTVSSSVSSATANTSVTLTATPDNGYMLDYIEAFDAEGLKVKVNNATWYEPGEMSFKMPGSAVEIKPVFVRIEDGPSINMLKNGFFGLAIPEGINTIKVYDNGGETGKYSPNCDGYLLLTAPSGKKLRLSGTIKVRSGNYSSGTGLLSAYDGDNVNVGSWFTADSYGTWNVPKKLSTGENVMLSFQTSGGTTYDGLDLTVTVVDPNGPHAINIETAEHGGFVNPPATAMPGEVVTLTATPDAGYILDKALVQDENVRDEYLSNVEHTASWYSNNEISFVMPQTDVTITPHFENLTYGHFYLSMNHSGTENMTIPDGIKTFTISDDYTDEKIDAYFALTAPEGKVLQVMGEFSGRGSADSLFIYNGNDTLLKAPNGIYISSRVASSNNLTIHYKEMGESIQKRNGLALIFLVVDPNKDYAVSFWDYSNGNIVPNTVSAKVNTPVSLSVTPDSGYYLHHVRIWGENTGWEVSKTGGTWYSEGNEVTFLMPGEDVNIEPYFASESETPSIAVSRYETIRATIPARFEEFYVNGQGVGEWEAAKPLILKAPEGYWFLVENMNHEYTSGFNAYDGEFADPVGSGAELMSGITTGRDLTLVYVGTGEYDMSIPVRLVDASVTHNVDVHYSGNGYAGGDLSSASTGNTINLTATPNEGYMIGSIYAEAYLDLNDESWSLPITGGTWYTSNDYSFTMPYADVRVNVEFVEKVTTANEGLFIEMPQRDTVFATIPADVESFAVTGNCDWETCNGTLVLVAPEGRKFQLTGNVRIYGEDASLTIFDGLGTDATKIWERNQSSDIHLNSSGDTLTLHSESGSSQILMDLIVTVVDSNKKYKIKVARLDGGTIDDYPESAAPGDTVTLNITTDMESYGACVYGYDLQTTYYEFTNCNNSAWFENQIQFVMPDKDLSIEVSIYEAEYGDAVIPRADTLRLDIPEGMKSIQVYSDYSREDYFYYNNSDGVLVLTAPEGYKLVVAEGAGDISDEGDSLIIYAGDGVDAERELATISVGGEIGELENTGRSLTFKFKSDGEGNGEGVYANVRVVDVNEVYSITLAGTWNGNMISDKLSATVGDTVTLVATPDEGYLLNYFTVDWEDFHGSWNSISPVGGTWYSGNEAKFVMPRGDVLIYAEFSSPNDYLRATIPTTDTVVANIPEGIRKLTVRTACGWAYCDNNDGVLVLTAPEGYSLRLSGNTALVDEDSLFIYDGAGTDAKVLAKMSNNNNHIDYIYSTGRSLAFQLKSNENGNDGYPELSVDVLKKSGSSAVAVYEYYNGYKFARIDGLYDGKDTVNIEEDIEVNDVEFIRNFTVTANDSGKYSTIVFPFDFNATSVSGLDDILEFSQMTEENGKLQVEMNRVWCRADVDPDRDCSSYEGNLKANTPYMLKMTDETLFFNGSSYTIKKTEPAVATVGDWQFIGTYAYKKWEEGDTDLGSVYGFAATASNGAEIGQFVKAGSGAFIRPMRAYLKHSSSNAEPRPAPAGHVSVWRDRSGELPEEIEVVVVEGKDRASIGSGESGSEKKTTVIGRINTRTGEFTPVTRTYDLKGRSLNAKPKAKGVYVGKKR